MHELKKELKDRARTVRGLANALGYDAENVFVDAENLDFVCLNESIQEATETVKKLTENLGELQYLAHVIQRRENTTRN